MYVTAFNFRLSIDIKLQHVAPFYAVADLMANISDAGISSSKLIMTLPMRGRSFRLKKPFQNEVGDEALGKGFGDKGLPSMEEICEKILEQHWKIGYGDKGNRDPYIFDKDEWVAFDDCDQVYE